MKSKVLLLLSVFLIGTVGISCQTNKNNSTMRIVSETTLTNFEFWSGARDNALRFTYQELEDLESVFEDLYGEEGITDTQLNDIMWFEPETLCEWLGIDYEEWERR